jgi:structural maintenance of chromosomes protein 6
MCICSPKCLFGRFYSLYHLVLTNLQRKRARLSGSAPGSSKQRANHPDSSSPISDHEQTPALEAPHESLPPSTQYEIDRDAGFVHLDHPERDDARATQQLLKRSELLGENHAAENGIIESVTMVNFMCHERLHVELGPLLNFITGKNGSGKSAILTAITLCLGGKASTTNRGASLKSFIKEGRDNGSLIIKIKNQGADAYQPDVYGQTIILERNFSKAGTSGFKLKGAGGKLVSNKKADVEEIIEYFQMQIDNPMSVLSQDNARQFLTTSTPATKYRFFVKGTQLEQLDNDYRLVSEITETMDHKLYDYREVVKVLKAKADRAQERVDIVNKHTGMRNAANKLGQQLAWAQVENEERELRERESVVTEAQEKIEQAEREAGLKDQAYQHTDGLVEGAAEAIQSLTDDLVPFREEEASAKERFDAADQELKNNRLEQRQIRDHLVGAKNKVAAIKKDISVEQQRIENANGGAHTKRLADLDIAQTRVAEARSKLDENIQARPGLDEQHRSALRDLEKSGIPLDMKKKEITACENQLQNLSRDVGQVMAAFDRKIPKLLNMIENDTRFREKPVGPVGLHIKLLKPIWSSVLDKSIGQLLGGFIVTSKADQVRLSGMIRQLCIDFCPVIIGNHHPLDTSGHEPDPQYDTVLRVLEINNDLVRSQLIINQSIEQTILVEGREDGMRILYEGRRPQNVKQCFCLNEGRRGWGIRLGYTAGSGNPSSGPIAPNNRQPRMKTDADSQIAYQRDTLEHLRREFSELQRSQRELQQTVGRCLQALKNHEISRKRLQIELQQAEENVERLQEELDRDHIEDGRLEAFKADLLDAEREVEQHGGSYGEAVMQIEKQGKFCQLHRQELDAAKERIAAHERNIKKAESKLRRIQQARQIALQEKNIAFDAIHEARLVKETAEQKRDRQANVVTDFIHQATVVCPRTPVSPGETPQSIEAKLDKLKKQLEAYSKKAGGSEDEIIRACTAAVRDHQLASRRLADSEELLKEIKKSHGGRLEMWRKFQSQISARSRIQFTYLLSERGFRGKLLLDHKHHLLEIQVEPDETTLNATGRATKTLSGGEKSFSSICLLLSVWEGMGAPLRCLDEYDVFMDHVNRDISTNMIVRRIGSTF